MQRVLSMLKGYIRRTLLPLPFNENLRALKPFRSTYSVGLTDTEILTPILLKLRQEAQSLIKKRDIQKFTVIAGRAAHELGNLPTSHRLWFNEHHTSPVFDDIMAKIFNKVCDLDETCELNLENTSSGYGIGGLPGVGKSTLLRLCTVIAPLLLPQVVSAYVDAGAHMHTYPDSNGSHMCTHSDNESQTMPQMTPQSLLLSAFQLRAKEFPWLKTHLSHMTDTNSIACHAADHHVVTMLCVDELRCVYSNAHIWSQLHQLATSSTTALFVADSSFHIEALIKSDSDSTSQHLLRDRYGVVNPSLNDTKLAFLTLSPTTERKAIHQVKALH